MMNNYYAIIVAGGKGLRMGNAVPKQFLEIKNKPVLFYSINAFIQAIPNINIVLVLPEQFLSYANTVLKCFEERINITIVIGGNERFNSVQNGYKSIENLTPHDILFVHDAARPLVSVDLIQRCKVMAENKGNAIPVIDVKDSLRKLENEKNIAVNRSEYKIIQTPQTFKNSVLEKIMNLDYNVNFTDEATALEQIGEIINLVEGEERNFKITNQIDFDFANLLLS